MRKLLPFLLLIASSAPAQTWTFAVAGDSRNCGDVVMPAIAAAAKADGAAFYWHLGDFRKMYDFDEDMVAEEAVAKKTLTINDYLAQAWPDFIKNQANAFAPLPVYLGIGNHELYNKTRADYLAQFADWLEQAPIQHQRLADDPTDHMLHTYFHWITGGVDFVTLDNASADMFDSAQVKWFKNVLKSDAANPAVKSVVVGMHKALPHSLTCDHSMDESAQGERSGVDVYKALLAFRKTTNLHVYVIASHSHFLVNDIYDSPYWRQNGGVLPGMIIGTAGAIRYRLPDDTLGSNPPPERAMTDVYGYLLGTVDATGAIRFDFRKITGVSAEIKAKFGETFVEQCFADNRDMKERKSKECSSPTPCAP
jgi:hypothetical protein